MNLRCAIGFHKRKWVYRGFYWERFRTIGFETQSMLLMNGDVVLRSGVAWYRSHQKPCTRCGK